MKIHTNSQFKISNTYMLNSLSWLHIPWYKINVVDAVAYSTCTAREPARRRTRRRVCCANNPTHRLALTSLQVKSNELLRSRPVPSALNAQMPSWNSRQRVWPAWPARPLWQCQSWPSVTGSAWRVVISFIVSGYQLQFCTAAASCFK